MVTEPVYPEVAPNGALVVPVRPPAAREAVAVADYDGPVQGQRVVVLQATEWVFDLRAVSGAYRDDRGRLVVDVASERGFYLQAAPASTTLNAEIVFIERPRRDAG